MNSPDKREHLRLTPYILARPGVKLNSLILETVRGEYELSISQLDTFISNLVVIKERLSQNKGFIGSDIFQVLNAGKILILGLPKTGKTTMLQRLKTGLWIRDTTPTLGMNIETTRIGGVTFSAWDLGGLLQFRRVLWEMYTKNVDGLIYVIDVSDPARLPEARNNLWRILKTKYLKDIPIAIFVNKVDVVENDQSFTVEDLANLLGISKNMGRVLNIFNTSGKTGIGIYKGIYWLTDAIQESGKHKKLDLYRKMSLFGRPSTIPSAS
ncbi:MAG: ADP-ribosylation factor family protein [Candidatus Hodarchaeales archaeon]